MKYLTKEWYDLSQQTGLHFGKRVHKGAHVHDEALYQRLYKRKEKEYVNFQRELYNTDPRFMLKSDGMTLVPLSKVLDEGEIAEEDTIIHHMSAEERDRIEALIAEYDRRPPFDETDCKQQFHESVEWGSKAAAAKLPHELLTQIADIRVFALGYCTKEVLLQLKKQSIENEQKVKSTMEQYAKAQQAQHIPESIRSKFNFHDCTVTALDVGEHIVVRLDTRGGFTNTNKVTFISAEMMKQDEGIAGCHWIYDELYRIDDGYEVHVLFAGQRMPEMIIRCRDILLEKEEEYMCD